MKKLAEYQNYRNRIGVEVYDCLDEKVMEEPGGLISNKNGMALYVKAGERVMDGTQWIYIHKEEKRFIMMTADCKLDISTADCEEDFLLNDAMNKALHGLVKPRSNESEQQIIL